MSCRRRSTPGRWCRLKLARWKRRGFRFLQPTRPISSVRPRRANMSVPQRGTANSEELEHAPGRERENLEGWIPQLAGDEEIRTALEKAFDYRGDVSITLRSGEKIDGYIFDRRSGKSLTDSVIRLYPKSGNQKISISYADIAALAFTGKDTAAGKSWEAWMKKYEEKKAAGEKNIGLQPEALE